jgi:hypothetical protein
MAAIGALLMSSGIALMAAPATADAGGGPALKDWVCKYVGTPGTGEHLKAGNDGLIWVDSHASQGTWFNDAHGSSYVLVTNAAHEPRPDSSLCPAGRVEISVDIHFVDATCDAGASYYLTGDTANVTVSESRAPEAGRSITVTATAKSGYLFDHFENTYSESYRFKAAPTNCTVDDARADLEWTEPDCDNENTVGYTKVADANIASWETSGTWEPGGSVTVTATAADGHSFPVDPGEDPMTTKVFRHTFNGPEVGCSIVDAPVVPAPPTFVEPTCLTAPSVGLPDAPVIIDESAFRGTATVNVGPIAYEITGDLVAGGTVYVDATATEGYFIPQGETVHWVHTFLVPQNCTIVSPPTTTTTEVSPPAVESTTEAETTTPTVVSAGLAGGTGGQSSDQQGLGLTLAGLLLMAGAGALVLVKGGERTATA